MNLPQQLNHVAISERMGLAASDPEGLTTLRQTPWAYPRLSMVRLPVRIN
jgi:hypothetical protein